MRAPRLAAAGALALVLAGCGGGGEAARPEPARPEPAPATLPTAPPAGDGGTTGAAGSTPGAVPEALRFSAAGVDGTQVVGADYAGRDVALWFWAPW